MEFMLNLCRSVFILLTITFSWLAHSAPTSIEEGTSTFNLTQNIEYFVDERGDLTLEDILAKNNEFRSIKFPFADGFSENIHWFRFTLERSAASGQDWLLAIKPTFLDSVRLYSIQNDQGYSVSEVGDLLPTNQRIQPLSSPFSLPILLADDKPHTFYIRLQTKSLTSLDLTLRTPQAEAYAETKHKLLSGIAIGAWLVLCFYGCVMSWLTKKKVYAVSCIYVMGNILNCLVTSGVFALYIFPNTPYLVDLLAPISVSLTFSGIIIFFIAFFDTKNNFKYLHWILILDLVIILITFSSLFFDQFVLFAPIMYQASHVVFFVVFYICWKGIKLNISGSRSLFWGHVLFLITNSIDKMGVNPDISLLPFFANMPEITSFIFIIMMYQGLYEHKKQVVNEKIEFDHRMSLANKTIELEKQRRIDQSNFMTLVTHELKTPITIIDSVLQTLKIEKIAVSQEISERHDIIRTHLEELNSLINKTLIAEGLEIKPFSAKHERVSFYDFIETAIKKTSIEKNEYEINTPKDYFISVDPALFCLMVGNLLVNAKKYKTSDSKISIVAKKAIKGYKEGTSILFSNYFEAEEEPNTEFWFKKYHRQMDTPNIQGFGLGLYLVKAVTEAHSGHIECHVERENNLWKITFDLWFPAPKKDQELTTS
jgi:signal transduction histidine kinase